MNSGIVTLTATVAVSTVTVMIGVMNGLNTSGANIARTAGLSTSGLSTTQSMNGFGAGKAAKALKAFKQKA